MNVKPAAKGTLKWIWDGAGRVLERLILMAVVAVPVIAVFGVIVDREPAKVTPQATILVDMNESVLHVAPGYYCNGDSVEVLVVSPSDVEKGTFASASGSGTLRSTFKKPVEPLPIRHGAAKLQLAVSRDDDDAAASKLAIAFANPTAIYLSGEPKTEGCSPRKG